MVMNEFGMLLCNEWIKSQKIRTEIELDSYIVMPNHLHGIVMIQYNDDQNLLQPATLVLLIHS